MYLLHLVFKTKSYNVVVGGEKMSNIGNKIKQLRKKNKDTLQQLAEKISYDYSNLSKVERGIYGASIDLIKRITEVYGVDSNYFFDEEFTRSEGDLLLKTNLDPTDLKKEFHFTVDGVTATSEEIEEAIRLIRILRKNS